MLCCFSFLTFFYFFFFNSRLLFCQPLERAFEKHRQGSIAGSYASAGNVGTKIYPSFLPKFSHVHMPQFYSSHRFQGNCNPVGLPTAAISCWVMLPTTQQHIHSKMEQIIVLASLIWVTSLCILVIPSYLFSLMGISRLIWLEACIWKVGICCVI